jgi:hypothetical protein
MTDPQPIGSELAALWRRQFEVYDNLVHGLLCGTVALGDLAAARHSLSVPRFYSQQQLTVEHFRSSDPLDPANVGSLEADWQRVRAETDGEFS